MKWCVIGAGGIADRRTIPAILKNGNNELVAKNRFEIWSKVFFR